MSIFVVRMDAAPALHYTCVRSRVSMDKTDAKNIEIMRAFVRLRRMHSGAPEHAPQPRIFHLRLVVADSVRSSPRH